MKKLMNHKKLKHGIKEVAATSNVGNIQQVFEINIHDGKGFYETGVKQYFLDQD